MIFSTITSQCIYSHVFSYSFVIQLQWGKRTPSIHQRLSLHKRKCRSSSCGWLTAKRQGRKSWVSHTVLLIIYFISHFMSLSLLYVRERGKVPYDLWMNEWMYGNLRYVKMQISDFLYHHKSMYQLWFFQLFIRDPSAVSKKNTIHPPETFSTYKEVYVFFVGLTYCKRKRRQELGESKCSFHFLFY